MDLIDEVAQQSTDFYRASKRFVTRCKKPDSKEFSKIAFATAVGFLIMGFIGFFVKLIHIPINNIIIGHQ